jgi:Domain of unknown function (DUF4115)
MARLRIRIELNRGGVGVPLHKLASVVDEAQKFFHLLAEDSHVDQTKGEWLGSDFGNESLNFTAEFMGPVTADQVAAFHAAFDGTTSLRRATIAQFARITEAIEQDELIGFGLYLTDDGNEPSEWRCLSRRDALRIAEEIQLLIEASGAVDRESHLPAVSNSGVGARLFSDRRERALESTKWTAYVREVEANLDRRISRVEHVIEGQSGLIEDLHSKSASTEDSVRKLLTAVEGFCAHTTRQLEAISAPAASAVVLSPVSEAPPETAQVGAASAAQAADSVAAPLAAAPATAAAPAAAPTHHAAASSVQEPEPIRAPVAETVEEPEPAPVRTWNPSARPARRFQLGWMPPAEFAPDRKRDWRLVAGFALLGIGFVLLGAWAWQNLFSEPAVQRVAATGSSASDSFPVPAAAPPASTTPPAAQSTQTPQLAAAPANGARVNLEASELTWVSLRDAAGSPILSRLFAAGDTHSFDAPNGATLRVGNAGGLNIILNGNSIGTIGPRGKVRDVVFKNGSFKIAATD